MESKNEKESWYKRKIEVPPGEIIYEVVTKEDGLGFGLAIAEVTRSAAHFHIKTHETYILLSGELRIHLGSDTITLTKPGASVQIPLHTIHWAEGNGRIAVITIPPWTAEDHVTSEIPDAG